MSARRLNVERANDGGAECTDAPFSAQLARNKPARARASVSACRASGLVYVSPVPGLAQLDIHMWPRYTVTLFLSAFACFCPGTGAE